MTSAQITRRRLLKGSGGIMIGFSLTAAFQRAGLVAQKVTTAPPLGTPAATPSVEPGIVATPAAQTQQDVQTRNVTDDAVDSYLVIGKDGKVTVYAGKVELGTGVTTSMAQIVAEDLDVKFDRVTMILGDTAITPDQGVTAGSKTLQVAGPVLREAAALARVVLLTRASAKLGVPAAQLTTKDGVVTVTADPSKSVSYGELATAPFKQKITGDSPVKSPAGYTIVGKSIPRVDILEKLTGGPAYIQDVKLDGMLHARVVRPYVRTVDGIGATIESVNDAEVKAMPGVVAVVKNGSFLGVVAEREEQAIRASKALKVTWSKPEQLPEFDKLYALIREMPASDDELVHNGDVDGALATAAKTLKATYLQPFQAHASIGPSCGVADVRSDKATIYSGSQGVYALRVALAPILGLSVEQVRVIYKEAAGCYGHNGADDASADAALLSQMVGKPVRVQWMRQDEFAWELKGPAMVSDLRGGLDANGNIIAWGNEVWTPTHSTRPSGKPGNLLVGQQMKPPAEVAPLGQSGGDRNAPNSYSFPNQGVTVHWVETPPLRPSALRSLGAVANTTANESFFDEMAALAGADPVEFRLRHLADPRSIAVVKRAAEKAGWETRPSVARTSAGTPTATPAVTPAATPGSATPTSANVLTGRGFAFVRYETEFTYAAVVAEVEVDPMTGGVRVKRVVVAHDCGLIVNPDGLTNQIQGCVIQGTSRALKEEVTFDKTAVTSLDWSTYHILGFGEIPAIEVELIDRPDQPAWGAGEPAICPIRAAIGNAIFDATGVRLRQAPYTPKRVLAALQGS